MQPIGGGTGAGDAHHHMPPFAVKKKHTRFRISLGFLTSSILEHGTNVGSGQGLESNVMLQVFHNFNVCRVTKHKNYRMRFLRMYDSAIFDDREEED